MPSLPRCKFWDKCYRKNPDHLKQYLHPSRDPAVTTTTSDDGKRQNIKQCLDDGDKADDFKGENSSVCVQRPEDKCKLFPEEEDDETTQGANGKEQTIKDQTNRKRRASSVDDDDNVSNRQKKMKHLNGAEASANEKTMENSSPEKTPQREKHLDRQSSGEKCESEDDDADKDDGDDDDEDDFLTIVSSGKTTEKTVDDKLASAEMDKQPLLDLPSSELLQVEFENS